MYTGLQPEFYADVPGVGNQACNRKQSHYYPMEPAPSLAECYGIEEAEAMTGMKKEELEALEMVDAGYSISEATVNAGELAQQMESSKSAFWTFAKTGLPDLLNKWAEDTDDLAKKKVYEEVASMTYPKDWMCWATVEPESQGLEPGWFIKSPNDGVVEPMGVVLMESVDNERKLIHHVLLSPTAHTAHAKASMLGWMATLQDKKLIHQRAEELTLFGL